MNQARLTTRFRTAPWTHYSTRCTNKINSLQKLNSHSSIRNFTSPTAMMTMPAKAQAMRRERQRASKDESTVSQDEIRYMKKITTKYMSNGLFACWASMHIIYGHFPTIWNSCKFTEAQTCNRFMLIAELCHLEILLSLYEQGHSDTLSIAVLPCMLTHRYLKSSLS